MLHKFCFTGMPFSSISNLQPTNDHVVQGSDLKPKINIQSLECQLLKCKSILSFNFQNNVSSIRTYVLPINYMYVHIRTGMCWFRPYCNILLFVQEARLTTGVTG